VDTAPAIVTCGLFATGTGKIRGKMPILALDDGGIRTGKMLMKRHQRVGLVGVPAADKVQVPLLVPLIHGPGKIVGTEIRFRH